VKIVINSRGQLAGSYRLGGTIERRRVPFTNSSNDRVNRRGKTCSAWKRKIALPLYRTTATAKSSTKVCTGWLRRTNSSQRRARNLFPKMVFHDRPVYQEEHAAQLIMAGDLIYLQSKAEYICADLSICHSLFPCSRAADHTFEGLQLDVR